MSGTEQVIIETTPYDPRFGSTVDQNKQCWTLYNEYLRCSKKIGRTDDKCQQIFKWARSICPTSQMKAWYEMRRDDVWYGYDYPMQEDELADGDELVHREKHTGGHH